MASFAITISPPLKTHSSPIKIHHGEIYRIQRSLNKFSHHYCLYPELDNNNRLHYHGIIHIDDMIKYRHTKHIMDKELGFIKIDKFKSFKDKLRYLVYSMKQWPENKDYFIKPIIYERLKRGCKPPTPQEDKYIKTILDWL